MAAFPARVSLQVHLTTQSCGFLLNKSFLIVSNIDQDFVTWMSFLWKPLVSLPVQSVIHFGQPWANRVQLEQKVQQEFG